MRKLNKRQITEAVILLGLIIIGLIMLFPIYLTVINAFKTTRDFKIFPQRIFPRELSGQNFIELMTFSPNGIPFLRYVLNSIVIASAATGIQVLFAGWAAYPLAKVKFPGAGALNAVLEASLIFSGTVLFPMQYIVISRLNLINTYSALILTAASMPLGVFILRQFIKQFPDSLTEAARIDGASHIRVYRDIILPNIKPARITVAVFVFASAWNATGFNFTYDESLKTFSLAALDISGGFDYAGIASAAAVLIILPPAVLFLFLQKHITQTMAYSGIKD